MAKENQVTKEPQGEAMQPPSGAQPAQQIIKEPQRVMKEPQGKVESNCKKREAKKQAKLEVSGVNQYYGIGAVIALGVIGGLGYYIYQTKKGGQPEQNKPHPQMQPQTNKFEMD